jgi:hypothetical protein
MRKILTLNAAVHLILPEAFSITILLLQLLAAID